MKLSQLIDTLIEMKEYDEDPEVFLFDGGLQEYVIEDISWDKERSGVAIKIQYSY